jgi:hypothetical protein
MKDPAQNNRQIIGQLGDLTESLYLEVASLPLSDVAKNALVMVMLGDITKFKGNQVTFNIPTPAKKQQQEECAQL